MKATCCLPPLALAIAMVLEGCGEGEKKPETTTVTPTSTSAAASTRTTTTTTTTTLPRRDGCLCAFDVDRTWTAEQKLPNVETACPGAKIQANTVDTAYGGGTLVLSDMALNLEKTFCKDCFMSIITAGILSDKGSAERTRVLGLLHENRTLSSDWTPATKVASSLVVSASDGSKQQVIKEVVDWFASAKNVHIADEEVHFFDDRVDNVRPFKQTKYNARQISCASRDMGPQGGNGALGQCGARAEEIVKDKGVVTCQGDALVTV